MGYTDDDLDRAARRFEQLADWLDPGAATVEHTDDLRVVAVAAEAVAAPEVGRGTRSPSVSVSRARPPVSASATQPPPNAAKVGELRPGTR